MASLSPPTSSVTRGQTFSLTVSASANGPVNSVTAVLDGDPDDITISNGTSSFTISGAYNATWEDKFTYVSAGASDKTETPTTVTYQPNVPPDENMYKLVQDLSDPKVRTYTVTVGYTDAETGSPATDVATFTHNVQQNLEIIRGFMANYNYNGTGPID